MPGPWPCLASSQVSVFFSCEGVCFAITLHSVQAVACRVWLPCLLVGWIFEKLFLVPDQPITEAPLAGQIYSAFTVPGRRLKSWPHGSLTPRNKNLFVRGDPENKSSTSLLHPLWGSHDLFLLLNLTVSNLVLSLLSLARSCSFLMLQITLGAKLDHLAVKAQSGKKKNHPSSYLRFREAKLRFI